MLNKAWELVCLNQFHDIIPGSSIAPVYVESQAQYAEIRAMAEGVIDAALAALTPAGAHAVVANPSSFARTDLAFLPGRGEGRGARGGMCPRWPPTGVLCWHRPRTAACGSMPANCRAFSVTPLVAASGAAPAPVPGALAVDAGHLENDFVRVELNRAGDITRIYDKVNRPRGAARRRRRQPVPGLRGPAHELGRVGRGHLPRRQEVAGRAGRRRSPWSRQARCAPRWRSSGASSTARTRSASPCSHNSAQIDITTDIDWHERHIFLKVAFPVDVLSPKATYEIQWGNTERPTHWNTSWDWARFETCAQKWVDLSEGGYGVSVLNDCKYGHDIKDNVIRISLLRGPGSPDPTADLGHHSLRLQHPAARRQLG